MKMQKFALSAIALAVLSVCFVGCGTQVAPPKTKIQGLGDFKNQQVTLCDKTVSPYLLYRGLEMETSLQGKDITINNVSDEEIAGTFLADTNQKICVTWKPMAQEITAQKGMKVVFDSSKIPGEIQDLCVVNNNVLKHHPELGRALTGAWYETLSVITYDGTDAVKLAKKAEAFEIMAKHANCSVDSLKLQFATTALYKTPAEALAFNNSKDLQTKQNRVRQFCFNYGLLDRKATSADIVGIEYPDGTIQGDASNVKMRYVSTFMQLAEDGQLLQASPPIAKSHFTFGCSVYAGWMPWYYANEVGILKNWADKMGCEIEFKHFSYGGSIDAFVAGQIDAVTLTNMDTFFNPAAAGVDSAAIIMGDYSNGNDQVIVRN